ncbi:MAG: hypothetical protein PHU63_02215 [Candidatus ainarchaeum sp.]|nr:hypothetical protein [Candidatus ainarchaeum sp.]
MSGAITVVKGLVSICIGAGLAYFWSTLNPNDSMEILIGVGAIGALASFVSLYFMGKGQG